VREALLIRYLLLVALAVLCTCGCSYSQESDGRRVSHSEVPGYWKPGLRRGTNEFGIWGGYSPFSFVLKGTSKDRQLLLFNLQYARTLIATHAVTLKYTADAVPAAFEFQSTQL
jgi:hypothetical protein